MKQHISEEQVNQLSTPAKARLALWWERNRRELGEAPMMNQETQIVGEYTYGSLPRLSIGQMIAALGEDYHHAICYLDGTDTAKPEEVCDALWEACKEVLERQDAFNPGKPSGV